MKLYILWHPTDESYTEEYTEFQKKRCIVCMADYTYDDYIYIKN